MNGSELVYLDNLRALYEGYAFPTTSFCASQANEIITTYYLTETDAMNETNPVNSIYSLTGTQNFYRKIKNINTNEFLIDDMLNVTVVTCTADTDIEGTQAAEHKKQEEPKPRGFMDESDDDDDEVNITRCIDIARSQVCKRSAWCRVIVSVHGKHCSDTVHWHCRRNLRKTINPSCPKRR